MARESGGAGAGPGPGASVTRVMSEDTVRTQCGEMTHLLELPDLDIDWRESNGSPESDQSLQ